MRGLNNERLRKSYILAAHLYIDDVFREIFDLKYISDKNLKQLMTESDYYLKISDNIIIDFKNYTDLNTSFIDLGLEGCFIAALKKHH